MLGKTVEIPGLTTRPMTAEDTALRERALLANINRVNPVHSEEELRTDSTLKSYTQFDPARGDYGWVLEDGNEVVGSAWVLFIKGNGFVAEDVPEMTLNVNPQYRGRGVGNFLINKVVEYGRGQGWQGISLFVERGNPARRLYARHNFVAQDTSGTMLLMISPKIEAVAVYCGSALGERPEFGEAARRLGEELARRGIRLIYGGGKVGLMGEVATACLEAGGEVTGVMPENLVDLEIAHPGLTELVTTKTMSERKLRMEELADAFIALPGGMGTLEELFEVLVRQQLGPYTGPFAFYNVEDFWTPMMDALRLMGDEGFIRDRYLDAIVMEEDLDTLFMQFDKWANPGLKWRD